MLEMVQERSDQIPALDIQNVNWDSDAFTSYQHHFRQIYRAHLSRSSPNLSRNDWVRELRRKMV